MEALCQLVGGMRRDISSYGFICPSGCRGLRECGTHSLSGFPCHPFEVSKARTSRFIFSLEEETEANELKRLAEATQLGLVKLLFLILSSASFSPSTFFPVLVPPLLEHLDILS